MHSELLGLVWKPRVRCEISKMYCSFKMLSFPQHVWLNMWEIFYQCASKFNRANRPEQTLTGFRMCMNSCVWYEMGGAVMECFWEVFFPSGSSEGPYILFVFTSLYIALPLEGIGVIFFLMSNCSLSCSVRLWAVTEFGWQWRAPWLPGTGWACRTLSCWRTTPARWLSSRIFASASRRTSFMWELLFHWDLGVFLLTCHLGVDVLMCFHTQTYIGSVLVSVNPYKDLEIYTKQHMERYRGVNFYEVSPHM